MYGRIGTCTQEFGTLASWLVDLVNLLTGNLDRVGGAMFTTGATGQASTKGKPGSGRGTKFGRATSRVGHRAESFGEFPVAALPEEIETPGEGQVRALITVGGNPVSSNPNSDRLDAAIASLEFMVSIDPYINETTRHADVILPPPSTLQKSHYDLALLNFAVRNVANYSPAVLPLDDGQPEEWEIMFAWPACCSGCGSDADVTVDRRRRSRDARRRRRARRARHGRRSRNRPNSTRRSASGAAPSDCSTSCFAPVRSATVSARSRRSHAGRRSRPTHTASTSARSNPTGSPTCCARRAARSRRSPTRSPPTSRGSVASLDRDWDESMVLVGRRHVRSNNSWMHNVRVLTKGRNRCTLQIHPDDADRLGLVDGVARQRSRRVSVQVAIDVEVTDGIRPGVVSIPHGFGQNLPGVQLRVAQEYRGVNTNDAHRRAVLRPDQRQHRPQRRTGHRHPCIDMSPIHTNRLTIRTDASREVDTFVDYRSSPEPLQWMESARAARTCPHRGAVSTGWSPPAG